MPDWLTQIFGEDVSFWLGYFTNGKHLAWYASFRFTVGAALLGGLFVLVFGLGGAALKNSSFVPFRLIGSFYTNVVRGIPDIVFFIFFPLAFEQGVEWFSALGKCSVEELALNPGIWPPCPDAQWYLSTPEYFLLASITLGMVYGAFAANVIDGAMKAVPRGQLEAARAFGMSAGQVLRRVQIPQMWIFALPGLSNVWMLLVKATSLLSLLQISDIVLWADRLGAPNYIPRVGLVHGDWRAGYYFTLFIFYIGVTYASERGFAALRRHLGRGMTQAEG